MKKAFSLHNKIIWRGKISSDLASCFYPSFYKDILKREHIFLENFRPSFENATNENLQNEFFPLYKSEIMGRENFTLEKTSILDSITEKIKQNPSQYKFLFIRDNNGELFGAAMLSVSENKLQLAYKAFRRDVNINQLRHKASLDYWGEKLIREYGAKNGLNIFSHGRDTHPYIGKTRIGLALYKLKAGTKPVVPDLHNPEKPVNTTFVDDSFLFSQKKPVVFFTNPDDNNFYQDCFLYYPKMSLHESLVNEFELVSQWAGLRFEAIEY